MISRRIRRAVVVLVTAFASITMVGATGASAHPCTAIYVGGETSVCATGPASVWNIVSLGFCGDLCYEVHSQPSVHTGGQVSVTVQDERIVELNVPERDVYLGHFCYTTAGGSC